MAQTVRQAKLFAAEDYTTVYESYIQADLKSYDYDTIRTSMVEYIRTNYPENYNDWVESSEFVALLDLIAQFGHNLAFRVDLNSRNNFLSTAQKKESVLKLAEFLGYQPKRNLPAFGMMKITSVKTNEAVIGSDGTSLGGKEIRFENTSAIDNLENFIAVINSVFNKSNPYGSPSKQSIIDGVVTDFYALNNTGDQVYYGFNGNVQGTQARFNAVGVTLDDKHVVETAPNPNGSFNIVYKNDNLGITSNNTGFFVGVKQGSLQFKDFQIDDPINSQSLDITASNVNETDVWVQTIDSNGEVIKQWTKVDRNVIYNTVPNGVRDIFSVKTRSGNQISVRFADQAFGNVPSGIIRVWYRTSADETYVLRPDDLSNKKISVTYTGTDGNTYNAVFELQLKENIVNASRSETISEIKESAPRAFASQNRMITADDYNSLLATQSTAIKKIKSINRTHSGHSRYLDIKDPTGAYSNLQLYTTDGVLTRENITKENTSATRTPSSVFNNFIQPILQDDELINLYYDLHRTKFNRIKNNYSKTITWQAADGVEGTSGYFTSGTGNDITRCGASSSEYSKYIRDGALVKLTNGNNVYWTKISDVYNAGLGNDDASGAATGLKGNGDGAVVIDTNVPSNSEVEIIYPAFNRKFTAQERFAIIAYLTNRVDFSLRYDWKNGAWEINPTPTGKDVPFDSDLFFNQNNDWMIRVDFDSLVNYGKYNITHRVVRFVLESQNIEFSNISNQEMLDVETKKPKRDQVEVYDLANDKTGNFYVYGHVFDGQTGSDRGTTGSKAGVYNPNKIAITLKDKNNDARPDNPDGVWSLLGDNRVQNPDEENSVPADLKDLRLEWTHVPSSREIIDPSFSNIIDTFVLTTTYDSKFRNWLRNNDRTLESQPLPPTMNDLNNSFGQFDDKKGMSDTIIYRPVKYKVLFGTEAEVDLQSRFRAVKMPNTNLTDNEIKSKLVDTIEEYFNIENWDFGETFFFTELAAFVHQRLSGIISSFVIIPMDSESKFGDLFQITPHTDEVFIPDVSISDIDIVTDPQQATNLR